MIGTLELFTHLKFWWEKEGYYNFLLKHIERPKCILWRWWNYKLMNRDNAKLIALEAKRWRGELVLYNNEVVKFLGWADIEEKLGDFSDYSDYYWILQKNDGKLFYLSCVGGFTRLKGRLSAFEYECLKREWEFAEEGRNTLSESLLKEHKVKLL